MAANFTIRNWEECFRDIFQDKEKSKIDLLKYAFNEFCMTADDFQSAISAPVQANPIRMKIINGDSKKQFEKSEFYTSETSIAKETVRKGAEQLIKDSRNGDLYVTDRWFITMITYFLANQEEFTDKKYSVTKEQLKKLFKNIRPLGNPKKKLTNWYNQYLDFVFKVNDWFLSVDMVGVITPFWVINDFKVDEGFQFRILLREIPLRKDSKSDEEKISEVENSEIEVEEQKASFSPSKAQRSVSRVEVSIQNFFTIGKTKLWLIIAGLLVVSGLLFFIFWNNSTFIENTTNYYGSTVELKTQEDTANNQCKFEKTNGYKIVILPLRSRLKLGDSERDIGSEIEERLDKLNKQDSLGMQIHYCTDFVYDKKPSDGSDDDYYRRIMHELNANHIIYGVTKDTVESSELTKVRIGYQTDIDRSYESTLSCKNGFEYNLTTLKELSKGSLLEDIEYVVYYNAILSIMGQRYGRNERKCLEYFERIEERKIESPELMSMKLIVFQNLGMTSEILELEEKLVRNIDEYEPSWLKQEILLSLGLANMGINRNITTSYLKKALDIKETGNLYYWLGNNYRLNEEYDKAIESFDMGIQFANSNLEMSFLYDSKQKVYHSQGRYNDALTMSEKAIDSYPEGECYWLNKGTNLFMLGEKDEALKMIDYSLELNSNSPDTYAWKGEILRSQGDFDEAIINHKKAIEISPTHYASWPVVYDYLSIKKDGLGMLKMLNSQLVNDPYDLNILMIKRMVCSNIGDTTGVFETTAKIDQLTLGNQLVVCEHGGVIGFEYFNIVDNGINDFIRVENQYDKGQHKHHWCRIDITVGPIGEVTELDTSYLLLLNDSILIDRNTFIFSDYN